MLPCVWLMPQPDPMYLLSFPPEPVSVPLLFPDCGTQLGEAHAFLHLFLCLLNHLLPGLSQDPGLAAPGGHGMGLLLLQGLQLWGQLGGEGV